MYYLIQLIQDLYKRLINLTWQRKRRAQGQRAVYTSNHCVTLPPAEHLLSAML